VRDLFYIWNFIAAVDSKEGLVWWEDMAFCLVKYSIKHLKHSMLIAHGFAVVHSY